MGKQASKSKVEKAEAAAEAKPKEEAKKAPKKAAFPKGKFWRNPTSLDGRIVKGAVTEADYNEFMKLVVGRMDKKSQDKFDFNNWVTDVDVEGERLKAIEAKRKKALGLKN